MSIDPTSLPFDEAIRFFRQKVNLPTGGWQDIWRGAHARAFVVAGATKDGLLTDLRAAVDKAISAGTTLEEFRKDFDGLVSRHGWSHKGARGWRTATIFRTNVRAAYQAGRHAQSTDPDVLADRPFWRYKHGGSEVPRPLHVSWDGKVLAADDPWWEKHYPPNGWGCSCRVEPIPAEAVGKGGPDSAPDDGNYTWKDKAGKRHTIPRGIDPGWDYNVGEAAHGRPLAEGAIEAAKGKWTPLTPGGWKEAGRPEQIALDAPAARLGSRAANAEGVKAALREVLGGEEKLFTLKQGGFTHRILVNAEALGGHIKPDRAAYLPFLPELLADPFEVWMSFERSTTTGRVALRMRYVKALALDKNRGLLFVANASRGALTDWTFIPMRRLQELSKNRVGKLIYGR